MSDRLIPGRDVIEKLGLPGSLPLGDEIVTLGRSRRNTIRLESLSVSREHAALERRDGCWWVRNLSRSNPVKVNGVEYAEKELASGDTLQVGDVRMRFESGAGVQVTPPRENTTAGETQIVERELRSPFAASPGPEGAFRRIFDALLELLEIAPGLEDDDQVHEELRRILGEALPGSRILIARIQDGKLLQQGETVDDYSATVIDRARRTGHSILWRADEDPLTVSAGGLGISSAICVPFGPEEQRVYLYLHRTGDAALFDSDDLERTRAFARVAGTIGENLRLRNRLSSQVEHLKEQVEQELDVKIAGPRTRKLLEEARKVGATSHRVLLRGPTGTGKEVFARIVHRSSRRADGAFVAINCAAIPDSLLESELFGYAANSGISNADPRGKQGKFELADGGTLFLDEIGDMPLTLQSKLLRVLDDQVVEPLGGVEARRVDFRLVCATHQDLEAAIEDGRFRSDLYHRIQGFGLELPGLADRPEEIGPLAEHFAAHYFGERNLPDPLLTPEAIESLEAHPWPGNVRELRNVIEGAVIRAGQRSIQPGHLQLGVAPAGATAIREPVRTLAELESRHIARVLEITGGNRKLAAELLGIHRNTLMLKLKRESEGED